MSDNLQRFEEYRILFAEDERLQGVLAKVFAGALSFCHLARDIFAVQENKGKKCEHI